ncbi:MAG TPA: NADH-quinone oxidoreductase subunit C [Acidimicrobiales bacterium]|nr:NADH-quinone oxidoreductase subunit C [Acidimicrobiales bacterium]
MSEQTPPVEEMTDTAPPSQPATLHGCPTETFFGAEVVHCNRDSYVELCKALKADGYAMPVGVTGVDYLTHPGRSLPESVKAERFEVVVELLSLRQRKRIRVRCQVPGDDPHVPTLFDVWPGVEAHERETYDMFGIRFDGHPDPSRILMPEDWEGHPLRKDYDVGHVPVQFKESPK